MRRINIIAFPAIAAAAPVALLELYDFALPAKNPSGGKR
jgi:hypothetical protein